MFNLRDNPLEFLAEHHAPELSSLLGISPKAGQVDLAEDPRYADKRAELERLLQSEMHRLGDPYELSGE